MRPKILIIAASLRAGSHNARLAALAAKELTLAEADVTRISLADYALPIFDADLMADSGLPLPAIELKRMLTAHRGVFIATPEYSASPAAAGGLRALIALRQILELGCGALVIPEQLTVGRAGEAFDDMDNLKDESQAATLKRLARRLVEMAALMPRGLE